jgi:hypothetical protein
MAALTTIAAGAAIAGTVGQIASSQKAAKASARAAEAQQASYRAEQKRAEVQNIRSVRQQIRQARMAQAGMTNVAALTGGMGGSGLAGGTSSIGSQMAGNLGFMADVARQNTAISNAQIQSSIFQGQAAQAQATGALWGQIGGLGQTIFGDMYRPQPTAARQGVSYANPSNAQMGNF